MRTGLYRIHRTGQETTAASARKCGTPDTRCLGRHSNHTPAQDSKKNISRNIRNNNIRTGVKHCNSTVLENIGDFTDTGIFYSQFLSIRQDIQQTVGDMSVCPCI